MIPCDIFEKLDEDYVEKNGVVYNYSSLNERYEHLKLLPNIPFDIKDDNDQYQFDVYYANCLINSMMFVNFFGKIIMNLMNGKDVYLLISDYSDSISMCNESLSKFIQSRYGYNTSYINDPLDLESSRYRLDSSTFTINGIYNYQIDMAKYIEITHGIDV